MTHPWEVLFLSKHVSFETSARVDNLASRLSLLVQAKPQGPLRLFRIYKGDRPFFGTVTTSGFRIRPLDRFGSNYAAILSGQFAATGSGTSLEIRVRPDPWFWPGWLLGIVAFGIWGSIRSPSFFGGAEAGWPLFAGVLILPAYVANLAMFWIESRRVIAKIRGAIGLYLIAENGKEWVP